MKVIEIILNVDLLLIGTIQIQNGKSSIESPQTPNKRTRPNTRSSFENFFEHAFCLFCQTQTDESIHDIQGESKDKLLRDAF